MQYSALKKTILACLALVLLLHGMSVNAEKRDIRIDIEWGANTIIKIKGGVEISDGVLISLDPDRLEHDDEHVFSENKVQFISNVGRAVDGFVLNVRGDRNTQLKLKLGNREYSITLGELSESERYWKQKQDGVWLRANRSQDDVLSIYEINNRYLLRQGEVPEFEWSLDPGFSEARNDMRIRLQLVREDGRAVQESEETIQHEVAGKQLVKGRYPIDSELEPGVYTVSARLLDSHFYAREAVAQILILPGAVQKATTAEVGLSNDWRLVDEVRVGTKDEIEKLRHDGFSSVSSINDIPVRFSGHRSQRTSKRDVKNKTMNWFGYRMKVVNPGSAHLLEITYPADTERRFVVSLIERNGKKRGANVFDVGIYTESTTAVDDVMQTKRIIFFPVDNEITFSIVNAKDGSKAAVAKIRLLESAGEIRSGSRGGSSGNDQIRLGGYLEDPHIMDLFGGRLRDDKGETWKATPKTDWKSAYEAIDHLCQYMIYRGYKELLLPVYTYGTALYPSELLPSTGRYDSGNEFRDGRHPIQKDIVALILELFDRYDLKLVPVFAFYTRIPALEQAADKASDKTGIRLVHKDGQASQQILKMRDTSRVGPHYNPLNPDVQGFVVSVVEEFSERYSGYDSLGDIGIQLNTTGWLQYPGLSWGYDAETIKMFLSEQSMLGSDHTDPENSRYWYSRLVTEDARDAWVAWRNSKIHDFYEKLANTVYNNARGRKLLLAYMNTFSSRYGEGRIFLNNDVEIDPHVMLQERAIDPVVLGRIEHASILRPIRVPIPGHEKSGRRSSVSVSDAAYQLFLKAGAKGEIHFLDYFESRLSGLSESWWWPVNYHMVATFDVPHDQRGVILPNANVYEGGWMLPQ